MIGIRLSSCIARRGVFSLFSSHHHQDGIAGLFSPAFFCLPFAVVVRANPLLGLTLLVDWLYSLPNRLYTAGLSGNLRVDIWYCQFIRKQHFGFTV
ncbi:hypothetical protein [uncultured Microbulbifer sp.]|uniref:hypothetical protein n=1 Tax=uncultured Microbulbifer sp. TaxID=348147 RepID=UPI00260F2DE4|nr:hypothetical protein [uncultured Microbulbifer sp.]